MSFKNKVDASFEEIIRLVAKVISGTGADSLFGFRTEVTGRTLGYETGDYGVVMNVAAGGSASVTVTPPAGELWRVKVLRFQLAGPSGATTGTHRIEVRPGVAFPVLYALSNYNVTIDVWNNLVQTATTEIPSGDGPQADAINRIVATNGMPLTLWYSNNTDAAQTGNLVLHVVREVEYLAS